MTVLTRLTSVLVFGITVLCALQVRAAELPDFRNIVKQSSPAVVKIIVEASGPRPGSGQPGPEEIPEYLRRFFEFRGAPPAPHQRMGMGSGFVISGDGYIVTNNHVVEGADSVLVRLSDRREFEAEVIGTDPRSDLALLKIDAEDLPTLRLAKNDELEVGEWVLAIGSPFGLDYSVTAGIVSAKGRSLPTENNENYVPFIQTDVAINPGNSGGPLFNLAGEVVGVNSQIFTRSGGSIGLSFAIPVSVVRNVVDQLKADGKVTRGWLGVTIQDVDKNLAESFGLDRPRGALVVQVAEDGPADDAGLREGDVIVRFDGKDIPTSSHLPHVVGLIAPGSRVPVEIMRDKKRKTIKVEVGGLNADDSFSLRGGDSAEGQGGKLGVIVAEAPQEQLERWSLSGGVQVREVVPGSPAAEAGIRPGDIITLVGNSPVKSVDAFEQAEEKLRGGSSVPLRLMRRGSPMFIGIKLPD
ncbi:DegQ family serine endoprotease [Pseudohalioglobus sediminis]|uniref:Probable periplasmic serine endoprotease DegP-like n=1 Tax=Pseudohalioglobus sediminis TaxID=2606449 RepID=A0A5B0X3Z7_9GAMM|nr:DegQ family serine endoprotease [Pseudohalioglobus sediminis]KAA1193348.1 DegQ family serine endoprotease [Pseudohalioglobus sediminis]